MFAAIWRYFRAFGYLITGRIDSARMALSANPYVIQATYDNIIAEKRQRIQHYMEAVAAMIAQEEKKKADLKVQSEETAKLKNLRDGAAAMAKKVVERHQGNIEAVKSDAEYLKCQAAFKDFSSTLAEKEGRCSELETDIETLEKTVAGHKVQLESLRREFDKISREKHEAVADMITAKEEKQLADMITGLSEDRTSKELQEMRDLRTRSKASARVSRELAGTDTKRTEAEFLEYAAKNQADSEFDKLIGLAKEPAETPEKTEPAEKSKLPEA
jgi:chromosome segregation ATPase